MSEPSPDLDPIQALDLRWQARNRQQVTIINNLLNDGYQYDEVMERLIVENADWQVRYEQMRKERDELRSGKPKPTIINS